MFTHWKIQEMRGERRRRVSDDTTSQARAWKIQEMRGERRRRVSDDTTSQARA